MNISKRSLYLGIIFGFSMIFLIAWLLDTPFYMMRNIGTTLGGCLIFITIFLFWFSGNER